MIGVIVATLREAQPLIDRLSAQPVADEPLPTFRFAAGGADGVIVISGMGPALAADAAERVIADGGATEVINIGVCGALSGAFKPGQLLLIASVADGDAPADAAGDRPLPLAAAHGRALPTAKLASVAEPVFRRDRRAALAARADVVDMEGFAVADACRRHGAGLTMLKAVSDLADEAGRADIQANIDVLSVRLADVVAAGLDQPNVRPGLASRVLSFAKVEHSIFSLPLLFAGAYLGAGGAWPAWQVLALIAAAGVGGRTLGMAANRIFDRKLDAANPRTSRRELPSGRMSLTAALAVAAGGAALYVLACAALGPVCLRLSPIPAACLIGYSLLKRMTVLCHFGIGLCMALAPLGAFVASAGNTAFSLEILLLAAFAFCWISGFDIIYALQDIDADRRTGVRSIPAAIGAAGGQFVAAGVHLLAVVALALLCVLVGAGPLPTAAAAVAVAAFVAGYWPRLPLAARFFPTSAIAGVAGAVVPLLGELR